MPLYKSKGPREDPNNYRGITLLGCPGKLFAACINSKIARYVYDDAKICYMSKQVFDLNSPLYIILSLYIFALHAIIEYNKHKKGWSVQCLHWLYQGLISGASLWLKLLDGGVNGQIFYGIYNMYSMAKSWPIYGQGEHLSPLLYEVYSKISNISWAVAFRARGKCAMTFITNPKPFWNGTYSSMQKILSSNQELHLVLSNNYCHTHGAPFANMDYR